MRLVQISDLYDPNNDWKPLLAHIAWLGDAYTRWRELNFGMPRCITAEFGSDSQRASGIHASEICHCSRQAAYSLYGVERRASSVPNVNMGMRFDLGHLLHRLIQDDFSHVCETTGGLIRFEDEVAISPKLGGVSAEYNVYSHCDGVFTFYTTSGDAYIRLGLEIKSMSKDEYAEANKPTAEHLRQIVIYQKTLDLPFVWLLYYNKSNSNWQPPVAPWVVPFDKTEWATMEGRIKQALHSAATGTLLPREEGMYCGWCPFSWTCEPAVTRLHTTYKWQEPPRKVRRK